MLKPLSPDALTPSIDITKLGFDSTLDLLREGHDTAASNQIKTSWIGQSEAEAAARFGLGMQHPGFHLIVIGEAGCGRTSLMLQLMQEYAAAQPVPRDLLYLYDFDHPEKPLALHVAAGAGVKLRRGMDQFIRALARTLPGIVGDTAAVEAFLQQQFTQIQTQIEIENGERKKFETYLNGLRQDIFDNLELFQVSQQSAVSAAEVTSGGEQDGMLESYLMRFRANLLVDQRQQQHAPVIYDDDPSLQSLFGVFESGSEHLSHLPEFLRLRAGNLLRADGGMLMLHLRDIYQDQHNGPQIIEKLHRFLRNGRVQIEESISHAGQTAFTHPVSEPLQVKVKLVMIATREEFYHLQDEAEDFARFFNVKVDFADDFEASPSLYQALAMYMAGRCAHFSLPPFSRAAVVSVLRNMHRWIEDQKRVSSRLADLEHLMLAAATEARQRNLDAAVVEQADVEAVVEARYKRHRSPEMQLLRSIVDGELMIRLQGREVGQINGLTHIDLGDAGFGSPVRISARCFAGEDGVINIDREVEMTGPNHDKGLFILQSWLSASFAKLTPLSLNASLVFEQEYHGVEGDSASCAELYALLSAISGVPLPQGIAVTGAMNQHGEVMAIGGVNEKIEGYFRVCEAVGLDGGQGVLIPARNAAHLVLNNAVIQAVAAGKFHIHTFSHVLEGLEYLTGLSAGELDADGDYRTESVMGRVQRALENFRKIYDSNKSDE